MNEDEIKKLQKEFNDRHRKWWKSQSELLVNIISADVGSHAACDSGTMIRCTAEIVTALIDLKLAIEGLKK